MSVNNILDLDAILEQTRSLEVRINGKTVFLKSSTDLSPREFVRLGKLQTQASQIQTEITDDNTEEQASLLESIIDEIIGIIGPDLIGIPFGQKTKVLEFYFQNAVPDGDKKK